MSDGAIVYQYATFQRADNFTAKPITVGCATKIGQPFVSQIDTFEGYSSLADDSNVVKNVTWDNQNTSEKAKKKTSFSLI